MKIVNLKVNNFRGIKSCQMLFDGHTALVGDNNTGKSTILEAIDLVLGPERLRRTPVINEHDFFAGEYIGTEDEPIQIKIELIVSDLNEDQIRHFNNNIEWWDSNTKSLLTSPPPDSTDRDGVAPALRVKFEGYYDESEDDFKGNTYCCSPIMDDSSLNKFSIWDKRICGFLFLRTLRTGSRALSLESGSLLDIILRLNDIRPKMWEDVLSKLRGITVADNPEIGISEILTSVQEATRKIVPSEWAENPKLLVSNLTREHLRKILTVFMSTGVKTKEGNEYAAPFQHQGTGTINTLVLALLSIIAEQKQNVIFAMEEPEIAIPPYTQKRVISKVMDKSAQAIFTSHSPYVLEEFNPSNVIVVQRNKEGVMQGIPATYPPAVKPKGYKEAFRKRFCEALLARRVLITEGRTEFDAYKASAQKLHDDKPSDYTSFEALGIAVISADTDSQVAPIGEYYKSLGKEVFAVFDKQEEVELDKIKVHVDHYFEAQEKGIEKVVLNGVEIDALKRYALTIVEDGLWPSHLNDHKPTDDMEEEELKKSMFKFFKKSKGSGEVAELLSQCLEEEMPDFFIDTIKSIKNIVESVPIPETQVEQEKETETAQENFDSDETNEE